MTTSQGTVTSRPTDDTFVPRPAAALLIGVLVLRLVLILLTNLVSYAGFTLTSTTNPWLRALTYSNLWIVPIDIVSLVVVARLLHREDRTLRGLFLPLKGRDIPLSLAAFVLMGIALFAATFAANLVVYGGAPPMPQGGTRPPLWFGIWCVTIMPVTIALAEEALYRGYALPRAQARFGRVLGFVLVAFFFGLQHLAFSLTTWQAATARVLALFLAGLAIAGIYRWFRRLAPVAGGHWLLDVVFLGLPILAASLAG